MTSCARGCSSRGGDRVGGRRREPVHGRPPIDSARLADSARRTAAAGDGRAMRRLGPSRRRRGGRCPRRPPSGVAGMAGTRCPVRSGAGPGHRLRRACRELGDVDGAALESEAAREVFERLGAAPDLDRLARESGEHVGTTGGLSTREVESPPSGRRRPDEPGDRRGPDDQRTDRRPARQQHLHEARLVDPRGRHRVRLRARPRLIPARYPCVVRDGLGTCTDAARGPPALRSVLATGQPGRLRLHRPRAGPWTHGRHATDRHDRHRSGAGGIVGGIPPCQAGSAVRHPRCRCADRRPLADRIGTRSGYTARRDPTRYPGMRFPSSAYH